MYKEKKLSQNELVSIIVPTKNEQDNIKACLESVKLQTYKNIEIIVVDNKSTDKTKEISKRYTRNVFDKGPERSAQRNYGAKKATGEYFIFIDSDMVLSKNVIKNCVNAIQSKKIKGVIIPEKSVGESFWAKCKALERSYYNGIDWIESPRFFSKQVFSEFGGYDEENTGTEDYDLPQRVKDKYGDDCFVRIKDQIIHNEGKLSLVRVLKKKYYYAKKLGQYKKNNENYFNKQSSIINRYKLFLSDPVRLFKNPVLGFGMLFMKTLEFASGGLGYMRNKIYEEK